MEGRRETEVDADAVMYRELVSVSNCVLEVEVVRNVAVVLNVGLCVLLVVGTKQGRISAANAVG